MRVALEHLEEIDRANRSDRGKRSEETAAAARPYLETVLKKVYRDDARIRFAEKIHIDDYFIRDRRRVPVDRALFDDGEVQQIYAHIKS